MAAPEHASRPECFLVVHNVAKKHNVGVLARSASAFSCTAVLLCGGEGKFNTHGAHGADAHVKFLHFATLALCKAFCIERGVSLVGVELTADAVDVASADAFTRSCAFLLGNEGSGLSPSEIALCDKCVYIPQYGGGTASLNVACAAAIVLHRFACWAGYAERGREGAKFVVDARPQRTSKRGVANPESPEEVRARRAEKGKQTGGAGDAPLALPAADGPS